MNPSLSVSIVVYELNEDLLRQTVISLLAAVEQASNIGLLKNCIITIVDNGANDALDFIAKDLGVLIYRSNRNVGYGTAHNFAIKNADSDYHLILNPDVIIEKHCITELLGLIQTHPETIAAGPLGVKPDGESALLCKRYPSVLVLLLRGFPIKFFSRMFDSRLSYYEYQDLNPAVASDVELLSGCFMLCDTSALKRLKGFDEQYFLYFEDFDLSIRLSSLGKIKFLPRARIVHFGGSASKKGAHQVFYFCRSALTFFRTHGWKWL